MVVDVVVVVVVVVVEVVLVVVVVVTGKVSLGWNALPAPLVAVTWQVYEPVSVGVNMGSFAPMSTPSFCH